jgi:uncharacterized repeat protein (TIGR03803 family)
MSRIRFAFALGASLLCASAAHGQTAPAVSAVVAFSISNPAGNLAFAGNGNLYGVVAPATAVAGGLVYRASPDGSTIETLYQLSPTNDALSPQAGLTIGSDGLLYGTTKFGRGTDAGGTGTVFRLAMDGTGFTILHRFDLYTETNANLSPKNVEGAFPEAELLEGADGTHLYGVAAAGGPNGTGTVFKVAKSGADFGVLHAFAADTDTSTTAPLVVTEDGAAPVGQLAQAEDGTLYGTTSSGGANGRGTIFRVRTDGTGFEVLKVFSATTADTTTGLLENADGAAPLAGLTYGADGNFYGVTSAGGTTGQGVIFSISTAGVYQVLHEFDGTSGQRPAAELLLGSDGKLYGTTSSGGVTSAGAASTFGTIFAIDRAGTNFTRLYSFVSEVGSVPSSKLVEASSGVLLGTVQGGGKCGYGAIFRYSAAGDTVENDRKCGTGGGNNNNNSGGGSGGPGLVLLLGAFAWLRSRRSG